MIKAIVAQSTNGVIGIDNAMPWSLSNDLKFFKETTENHIVVMGRKTFESIGRKPLPNRVNIVITSNPSSITEEGVIALKSPEAVMSVINEGSPLNKDIFIIGGEQIYRAFLHHIEEWYVTVVYEYYENGDAYNPFKFIETGWDRRSLGTHDADEKNSHTHSIYHYTRR